MEQSVNITAGQCLCFRDKLIVKWN